MPKLIEKVKPFKQVIDPPEVKIDPTISRALLLFDSLRKRGVGAERSAYTVSQVFAKTEAYPIPGK